MSTHFIHNSVIVKWRTMTACAYQHVTWWWWYVSRNKRVNCNSKTRGDPAKLMLLLDSARLIYPSNCKIWGTEKSVCCCPVLSTKTRKWVLKKRCFSAFTKYKNRFRKQGYQYFLRFSASKATFSLVLILTISFLPMSRWRRKSPCFQLNCLKTLHVLLLSCVFET